MTRETITTTENVDSTEQLSASLASTDLPSLAALDALLDEKLKLSIKSWTNSDATSIRDFPVIVRNSFQIYCL